MADIYEIARLCGVSSATVSRVINGNPKVSAETKARVLQVIDEIGFVPNAFARGLNFNSLGIVGVVCTDFGDVFFSQAVSYIENLLKESGFSAMLVCTGYSLEGKKQGLEQLALKNVDAIVLIGTVFQEKSNEYIAEIAKRIPVFTVNSIFEYENVYSVRCDEREAAKGAAIAFSNAHCKHPLCLYEQPSYGNLEKVEGFKDGAKICGINVEQDYIVSIMGTKEEAISIIKKVIAMHGDKVDAIFATNDTLAVYALKAMKAMQIELPVIGFNNSMIATLSTPEITSIDNRLEEMCKITVEHLTQLKQDHKKPVSKTLLKGNIVYRETFQKG